METVMDFIRNAKFISAEPEWKSWVPKFRKCFSISSEIKKAEIQITALGTYVAEINGERIGDFIMAPGWTEYQKRVLFQTYDITDKIKKDNTLIVGVGGGWYNGTPGFDLYPLDTYPAFIAAVKLTYECGKAEIIITDESWECAKSETVYASLYNGETTDARITPEYSFNAIPYNYPMENLTATDGVQVIEAERLSPKKLIITPKGETVIDFGQDMTGYVEFKICGKAGEVVKIDCAEILDKDGNFYNGNYRSAKALVEYTLKDGEQTYKPLYTFYGFRYIRLQGWTEDVKLENFTAIVLHSDIKRTGSFVCGHQKINKLFENIIWGQRGNFLDVPTDCPQRDERLGWTGDAQVFCRTAFLNYDGEQFFKKWLRDVTLAQFEDGGIPRVVPNVFKPENRLHSSAWGDAATVCPYELYMAYGDKEFLAEMFQTMKNWVGYIEGKAENYVWNSGFHFGDWLALDVPNKYIGETDLFLIATAFFFHSTELVIKAGKILGKDVSHYEEILPKIKDAFCKNYIVDGKMTSDTQTAYVLAIHFGLAPTEMREQLFRRLIELIEERGDTLTTGFVGTPYLLDTLTEMGRADKAYTLLLQEKFPSWLYSVNMGATTVWEHWDGINENGDVWSDDMNSFNHYAYGSVAAWMYRTVCGIKYDESAPAYKHFFIEPITDARLGSAKATVMTRHGEIISEWRYEPDGMVRYAFEIPKGTTATLILNGKTKTLTPGKYTEYTV